MKVLIPYVCRVKLLLKYLRRGFISKKREGGEYSFDVNNNNNYKKKKKKKKNVSKNQISNS